MVQLFRRQVDAGTPVTVARRLLRRRNLWLLVFGFVHAALLWYGDVLGAYGLAGLVMVARSSPAATKPCCSGRSP